MIEQILVVKRENLFEPGFFEGFLPYKYSLPYIEKIANFGFSIGRNQAEDDPNLKQVISYAIIRHQNTIYAYQRTTGSEKRLRDLWSLGVGGHIRMTDGKTIPEIIRKGALRELKEELNLVTPRMYFHGLLNLEERRVDQVHLGAVFVVEAEPPLKGGSFFKLEELKELNLENWSKALLGVAEELVKGY